MKTLHLVLYLLASASITLHVGNVLYKNGRPFILRMLPDESLTDFVNKLLLIGYYLVNLGYVGITLTLKDASDSVEGSISSLAGAIGRILLTLGIMHYLNILAVTLWSRIKFKS